MRGKSGLALGLAIGYVFGTKAGRERYEQLSQSAKRLANDPSLRRLQGELGGLFNASKQQATATIEGTATRAADKVQEANERLADQQTGSSPASTTSTGARSSSSGGSRSRSTSTGPRPSSRGSGA
jgi:hypothetical protein